MPDRITIAKEGSYEIYQDKRKVYFAHRGVLGYIIVAFVFFLLFLMSGVGLIFVPPLANTNTQQILAFVVPSGFAAFFLFLTFQMMLASNKRRRVSVDDLEGKVFVDLDAGKLIRVSDKVELASLVDVSLFVKKIDLYLVWTGKKRKIFSSKADQLVLDTKNKLEKMGIGVQNP